MHEAKTTLSKLVERAQAGEEIVITRNGEPVAQLTAMRKKSRLAEVRGALPRASHMPDDVELPQEFKDAFGMV